MASKKSTTKKKTSARSTPSSASTGGKHSPSRTRKTAASSSRAASAGAAATGVKKKTSAKAAAPPASHKKTSAKSGAAATSRSAKSTTTLKVVTLKAVKPKVGTVKSGPTSKKKTSANTAGTAAGARAKGPAPKKKTAPRAAAGAPKTRASATKQAAGATTANGDSHAGGASKKKRTTKKPTASTKAAASSGSSGSSRSSRSSRKVLKKTGRSVTDVASTSEVDASGYVFINGRRVRMISTGSPDAIKKKRRTRPVASDAQQTAAEAKPVKTKLRKREIDRYRKVLLDRRLEIVGDLGSLEAEALRSNGGDVSHMPIHMADIGTDTYDQDFLLGLAETERTRLREIDDALMRIQNGIYGVCQQTGKQIPKARLEAKPWAKYTIEAAREIERGYP